MISDELIQLLRELLKKSKADQVKWIRGNTEGIPEDYYVYFPNATVNVWRDKDETSHAMVLNGKGVALERIGGDRNPELEDLLNDLVDSARWIALDAKSTLRNIREALSRGGVIGDKGSSPVSNIDGDDDIPF